MSVHDKHEIAKRSILDNARPLIGARGFSTVGIAQILVAARIPKGSFYHYFDSKERFGEELLSLYITDYLTTLENLFSNSQQNGYEKICVYLKFWQSTHIDGKVGDKCLIVKLAAEMADLSENMREIMQRGTAKVIERLADIIQNGQQDSSITKELPAAILAATLYQTWLGATLMLKITKHTQPFDVAWQTSTLLLKGFPELR